MNHRTRILLGSILVLTLTGCGSVPGSLRPRTVIRTSVKTIMRHESQEAVMARYLDTVAAGPETKTGKIAGGQFMQAWSQGKRGEVETIGPWQVRFIGDWKPDYFDHLLPAAEYEVRGLQKRNTRDGIGVALVGSRHNAQRDAMEAYYPPELISRPVTAVFTFGPGREVTIALLDAQRDEELAADFTAPFAQLLSRTRKLNGARLSGLISASTKQRSHGLYLMEPYDARKTPVLMVHGLLATPLSWAKLTNDLWGDAEFRQHHQIWHYFYPTSAPFLYSAKLFREQINEVRQLVDPEGDDPASHRLDIIAHSMGGLLTRTLITYSGEGIWNTIFTVPTDRLKASPEDYSEAYNILHWKARRDVRSVIFIAVPHRGSDLARSVIGRIGDSLAATPVKLTQMYMRLTRDNPEAIQPAFRRALASGKLSSIDTLSPNHPVLAVLNGLPVKPEVTLHSIIGNRGDKGQLTESSDGVVPYRSSHLENAVSEVIVPTGHGAFKDPQAVVEILRIMNGPVRR